MIEAQALQSYCMIDLSSAWQKVASRWRKRAAVSSDELTEWFETKRPGSKWSLDDMVDWFAYRYGHLDPDGPSGLQEQLRLVVVEAAHTFPDDRGGQDRRAAFEAYARRACKHRIVRLIEQSEIKRKAEEKGPIDIPSGRVMDDLDLSRPMLEDLRRLAADMEPDMQAGLAALMEAVLYHDSVADRKAAVEEASGMDYRTFCTRLRKNSDFTDWLTDRVG